MQDQAPSIGRIVHYSHHGKRLPAIVTRVRDNNAVDLTVFGVPTGNSIQSMNVDACPYESETTLNDDQNTTSIESGSWTWPPRAAAPTAKAALPPAPTPTEYPDPEKNAPST